MLSDSFVWLTNIGDSLVLGAMSFTLAVYFLVSGYRREALAAISAYMIPAALIAVLKLGFYACMIDFEGVSSPSGHAALSVGFMGICALMAIKLCNGVWRSIVPLSLLIIITGVSVSRVVLGMHSVGDVIAGVAVGLATIMIVSLFILKRRIVLAAGQDNVIRGKPVHPAYLLMAITLVGFFCYGVNPPSDRLLREIAKRYVLTSSECR